MSSTIQDKIRIQMPSNLNIDARNNFFHFEWNILLEHFQLGKLLCGIAILVFLYARGKQYLIFFMIFRYTILPNPTLLLISP